MLSHAVNGLIQVCLYVKKLDAALAKNKPALTLSPFANLLKPAYPSTIAPIIGREPALIFLHLLSQLFLLLFF